MVRAADHPFGVMSGGWLEENLQRKLDSSWDVALAARSAKSTAGQVRIHRAEENPVEDVATIGVETDKLALAKIGVLRE